MLKKHRNALLQLIRESHFDPRKFTPKQDKVIINYFGFEGYHLALESSSVDFTVATTFDDEVLKFKYNASQCIFTAEGPKGRSGDWSSWTSDFTQIEEAFKRWLNSACKKYFAYRLQEEEDLNTPDLWAELFLSPSAAADFQALENTPFVSNEESRISETLSEFLKEVESQQILEAGAMQDLRVEVDYIIAASKRLGRKDWLNAALGALFSFTLQAGLTGTTAAQLLRLAIHGLQWIVVHTPLLYP
jgi:hypothetical protein